MVSVFCPVEDEADQGLGQAGFHRAHHLHRSLRSVHEYQPAPEVHLPTRGLRPGVLPVLRVRRRVPDLPRGQGHQQLQGAVRGGGRGQIPLRALAARAPASASAFLLSVFLPQGDSGGPLTVPSDDGSVVQIGLTSFGCKDGCTVGCPVGFTRVNYFLDWLSQTTGVNFP